MKYFVLWKKDSPLLKEYLDRYFQKISSMLQDLLDARICDTDFHFTGISEERSFLLHPDISTLILFLHKKYIEKVSEWFSGYEEYKSILTKQLAMFSFWEHDKLSMFSWEKIGDTEIRLSLYDHNPYHVFETDPNQEIQSKHMWWGTKPKDNWLTVYEKTFQVLKQLDEWTYSELNQVIKKIVPLWTSISSHNSSSYLTSVGSLYMWYTIDSDYPEFDNLEAIIHESSHNKLLLIMQFHDIILNDKQKKFYSPYRNDARHMHGVYIWLHAFAPVVFFMMKAYEKDMFSPQEKEKRLWKIVLYYMKNKIALRVIKKYAKLDHLGLEILSEIEEIMAMTDIIFRKISVSTPTIRQAKDSQIEHFKKVNTSHTSLEY